MKLIYLKGSLEISRASGWGDTMAMWDCFNVPGIVDGSTRTLETIKEIRRGAHYENY